MIMGASDTEIREEISVLIIQVLLGQQNVNFTKYEPTGTTGKAKVVVQEVNADSSTPVLAGSKSKVRKKK